MALRAAQNRMRAESPGDIGLRPLDALSVLRVGLTCQADATHRPGRDNIGDLLNDSGVGQNHIGGATPSLPTVTLAAANVPPAFFIAMRKTGAPSLRSSRVAGAKVTIGAVGGT